MVPCFSYRQVLYLAISCFAVGSANHLFGQLRAASAPVNCVVTNSCIPYPTPDTLSLTQLPNGSISLNGPVSVFPVGGPNGVSPASAAAAAALAGDMQQGAWATQVIQTNTLLPPVSQAEAVRLSQPLDLLNGEPLSDATITYPFGQTKVKNASVVFEVPISFITTGEQYYPSSSSSSGCPQGPNPCYFNPQADGVYGSYSARVEDCLTLSEGNQLALTPVRLGNGQQIPCNTADGILSSNGSNNGFWYDIAPAWSATATLGPPTIPPYQSIIKGNSNCGAPGPAFCGTLKIPAHLPVPSNSVRIEFLVGLKDSPNGAFIDDLYYGPPSVSGATTTYNCCDWAVTRFAVQFQTIRVLPAAFIQMNVLPYTIVYRPPGDQSFANFTVMQSFGTSMTVGNNTTLDNSSQFQQSYDVKNDNKVTALLASIEQIDQQTTMTTSLWDQNVVMGTGLAVSNSSATSYQVQSGMMTADTGILPAHDYVVPNTCGMNGIYDPSSCTVWPPESYQQEPFKGDIFVLLLHPQAMVWDFNGNPGVQLLGASGFDEITVSDLIACAQSTGWTLGNGTVKLSPTECNELLTLDPFYSFGQGYDPSVSGRGFELGGGGYGRDPKMVANPSEVAFQQIFSYGTAQTTSGSATYASTVTDVIGFSWSNGLTLGYQYSQYGLNVGFSTGTTVTQGETQTNATSMKINYTASTVATSTNTTTINGAFGDDHDFDDPMCQQSSATCYHPYVTAYIDELFGGFMFQDQAAACNPINQTCRSAVIMVPAGGSVTGVNQAPAGKLVPLPAQETSAVVKLRSISQSLAAYAQAHPGQGYPSSIIEAGLSSVNLSNAGYKFTYISSAPDATGKIDGYQISADPVNSTKATTRHFFTDQSGVIRSANTGPANTKSAVLMQ